MKRIRTRTAGVKAKSPVRALLRVRVLWVLAVVVTVAVTVCDVFCLAYLMQIHVGLPYDTAVPLSAIAMMSCLAIAELVAWAVCKAVAAMRSKEEAESTMNHQQLSELLSNMNSLQVGSFEARQALIRESFEARYRPGDFQVDCKTTTTIDVEPIQAERQN